MEKRTRVWLITAACLLVLGLVLFSSVMSALHWDFSKLSTTDFATTNHELTEEFDSIFIETDTADIIFAVSDNGQGKVVCIEQVNAKHSVSVQDGVLKVGVNNDRKWYEYIGITMYTPKITVYLPQTQYNILTIKESTGDVKIPDTFQFESMDIRTDTGDVKNYASTSDTMKIVTDTGDIHMEGVVAGGIDLSVTTGDITLRNVTCKNLDSTTDTGDIKLENVIADGKIAMESDTGDVHFVGCDAAALDVETDTGDVTGTLLTDKVFIVESDAGHVDVPKTSTGGRCEISTDTGDITIHILN